MGGDVGPAVMLAGAARAHKLRDDLCFLIFGDESLLQASLRSTPRSPALRRSSTATM
jgi:glycerol-3-phosphate acyltransferase PlsX